MFYVSQSECCCVLYSSYLFQRKTKLTCINIANTSFGFPHNITFYSILMLQQIHQPNACGTEIYSTTVDVSSSCAIKEKMFRHRWEEATCFGCQGPLHLHGSLKQQNNCIKYCHSIIPGVSFMFLSNICYGNSFYKFGDLCFVKRYVACLSSRMVPPMTYFQKFIKQLCLLKTGFFLLYM